MALHVIYGGAFDPVHEGHLAVARTARDTLAAVIALVPTGDPRHRDPARATASQRVAMLERAIATESGLVIDTRELVRSGASYTVDTLSELRAELGSDAPLAMIVGSDSFASLPQWDRWQELFELAHIVVASRPQPETLPPELERVVKPRRCDIAAALHQSPAGRVLPLPMPLHPQSSSAIRTRCAQGESLEGWVPASVAAYIQAQGLYRQH